MNRCIHAVLDIHIYGVDTYMYTYINTRQCVGLNSFMFAINTYMYIESRIFDVDNTRTSQNGPPSMPLVILKDMAP
jgi:hypothetical protein